MDKMVPKAIKTIVGNLTKEYSVIAAAEGPGIEHKEYLHIWPRDAFLVSFELMNFDYDLAERIAQSIIDLPHDNGMLYQRYEINREPDPHGWCNSEDSRQLDQDALKFVAMSKFPSTRKDIRRIRELYSELTKRIKKGATSTDVWEQKKGYFFYTTASIIWGLMSAEKILPNSKRKHKMLLEKLVKSIESFYDSSKKSFVKSPSERIIDLEVVLGINILFESCLETFTSKENLPRILSTLKAVEAELCHRIGKAKVPIRYKGDFWNGETVGQKGSCRPWPMGCAMISQAYLHLAEAAIDAGDVKLYRKAARNARRWIGYARKVPNIDMFPEQIDYDGSVPKMSPKPLTWCAAEFLKTERMFHNSKRKAKTQMFYLN